MLKGKISNNPHRFEGGNGIVFTVNEMNEDMREYFNGYGVEFHELVSGVFYTETVMTEVEFSQLHCVMESKQIA